ncbi:unnamed protein product [Blepharisma stoltei]|uniref:ATPase ASNA1 homolog n=1 Tax=Blepharisma stoltei TaxID=1481888 RepID=A0AAU9IQ60_9CILI|nr:unnamed protein product [Blepharisma stoltei]
MEPAHTLQSILDERSLKWVFVGGKGGVGKTSVAASLGILLSRHRESVLIISTDPAHNLSDAFDQQLGPTPTRINGVPNLYGMEIKPQVSMDSVEMPSFFGVQADPATKSLMGEIMASIPGIDEAMSFSELLKTVQEMSYSMIIFDTAPTGHTLRLLNFPTILNKGLAKIVSLKQNLGALVNQVSNMFGRGEQGEQLYNTAFERMEQMKNIIEEVNKQFQDPSITTFVAVCIPEFLSIYETERLVQELCKFNINIEHIVVNQVLFPEDKCRMCIARQRMQQKYMDQIKELYEDFHIVVCPLLEEEVRGTERLSSFSRYLLEQRQ